jgi:hypothetical protein
MRAGKTAGTASIVISVPADCKLPSNRDRMLWAFTLNLKTAKAIGVSVPTSILLRADEVIE